VLTSFLFKLNFNVETLVLPMCKLLQDERDGLLRHEKEINLKLKAFEVSRRETTVTDARIPELSWIYESA